MGRNGGRLPAVVGLGRPPGPRQVGEGHFGVQPGRRLVERLIDDGGGNGHEFAGRIDGEQQLGGRVVPQVGCLDAGGHLGRLGPGLGDANDFLAAEVGDEQPAVAVPGHAGGCGQPLDGHLAGPRGDLHPMHQAGAVVGHQQVRRPVHLDGVRAAKPGHPLHVRDQAHHPLGGDAVDGRGRVVVAAVVGHIQRAAFRVDGQVGQAFGRRREGVGRGEHLGPPFADPPHPRLVGHIHQALRGDGQPGRVVQPVGQRGRLAVLDGHHRPVPVLARLALQRHVHFAFGIDGHTRRMCEVGGQLLPAVPAVGRCRQPENSRQQNRSHRQRPPRPHGAGMIPATAGWPQPPVTIVSAGSSGPGGAAGCRRRAIRRGRAGRRHPGKRPLRYQSGRDRGMESGRSDQSRRWWGGGHRGSVGPGSGGRHPPGRLPARTVAGGCAVGTPGGYAWVLGWGRPWPRPPRCGWRRRRKPASSVAPSTPAVGRRRATPRPTSGRVRAGAPPAPRPCTTRSSRSGTRRATRRSPRR